MAEKRESKRTIPGRPEPKVKSSIILKPSVENLLNDTLQIIACEIARYRGKVESGRALDPKEARVVQGYAKNLKDLSEESRAHRKEQELNHLTDEELMQLIKGDVDVKIEDGKVMISDKGSDSPTRDAAE